VAEQEGRQPRLAGLRELYHCRHIVHVIAELLHVKPFPVRLSAAPQIDSVDCEIGRDQLFRCPSEIAAMRVEAGHDDDDAAGLGVRTPRANEERESSRCLESLFNGRAKLRIRHAVSL
jgi:hypothetical protein